MKRVFRKGFFMMACMVYALSVRAQPIPDPPNPPRLVNDFAGMLSAAESASLEQKLVAFNDSTSTQIAIVIIPSLNGYPVSDFAFRLGEKWGIGRKGKNNGALILVAKNDREVFIATGYGLEGAIPDALAKRIVETQVIPMFKAGRYFDGLDQATDTMMKLASGEYTADEVTQINPGTIVLFVFLILFFIFIFVLISYKKAKDYARVNGIDLWTAWQLMNAARNAHRGTWGSFSSGRGGFGSGGFGGFGGGSFGGGGAGGKW